MRAREHGRPADDISPDSALHNKERGEEVGRGRRMQTHGSRKGNRNTNRYDAVGSFTMDVRIELSVELGACRPV
jgi:hypothetical protein